MQSPTTAELLVFCAWACEVLAQHELVLDVFAVALACDDLVGAKLLAVVEEGGGKLFLVQVVNAHGRITFRRHDEERPQRSDVLV